MGRPRYNPVVGPFSLIHVILAAGNPMSQAIVDPNELRRFAATLKRFKADLQTSAAGVHGSLVSLGDTWRDQEHDRFREEFEREMQEFERFYEQADDFIQYLLRKAERIEEYLSQR